MTKKSTKSVKPAAPQVKPVKVSVAAAKPTEAKPVKKAAAPKKKVAAVKPKPVVAPAPAVIPTPAKAPATPPEVTITALIDIGFGNLLFVRGEGAGLSWNSGIALECDADNRWSVTLTPAAEPVVFKLLVNDLTWSAGENFQVAPGGAVVVTPTF